MERQNGSEVMINSRSIKFAKDKITGKHLNADEIFNDRQIGFDYRIKYNRDEIQPYCVECGEKLIISSSKYQNIHFKHSESAIPCILKENLTSEEIDIFSRISYAKESDRHIYLKNSISEKLLITKGISNLRVDDHFIYDGYNKRRPDIYCEFLGKKIVFEIQLSQLSQKYILSRYDFYKKKGIYLIWLLDDLNILEGTSQMARDIKYLSTHQNYFRFDENSDDFSLECKYKSTHLSLINKFYDRWNTVSIGIDRLNFDIANNEVFFYDFGKQKILIEETQRKNQIEDQKRKREEEQRIRLQRIQWKIDAICNEISEAKNSLLKNFGNIKNKLFSFDNEELDQLNEKLSIDSKFALQRWLKSADNESFNFLKFIFENNYFVYDINIIDQEGNTVLDILFKRKDLKNKDLIFELIIKRGYKINDRDEKYLFDFWKDYPEVAENIIMLSNLSKKIDSPAFRGYLFQFKNIIRIIESAKQGRIIGYAYKDNEWIKFANNALNSNAKYWEYIEVAFKYYGLYDKLILLDKKKTFQNKLNQYYLTPEKTDHSFKWIFKELYPELVKCDKDSDNPF
ncbi:MULTISPECIES: DUF6035 family protein [Elizabethkingia]|uniref:DUF6035 family protein n=1 Tax=Elizabethkingia TaxID=308865 RepID=UPI0021A30D85|nr:hypothetical protein [Elizabethkingia anophelis]MCT4059585.1 hypothetical protein [Elizabethkingia anophelis]MCT4070194.1 hypothetical protein [Elizabethkingia anophelis]MCT4320635.1 hypothetical protein [Elizabethkingia anophelis]